MAWHRQRPRRAHLILCVVVFLATAAARSFLAPQLPGRHRPLAHGQRFRNFQAAAQGDVGLSSTSEVADVESDSDGNVLEELLAIAAPIAAGNGDAEAMKMTLMDRVEADLPRITPEDMTELQSKISTLGADSVDSPPQLVANALQSVIQNQMGSAKQAIQDLLDNPDQEISDVTSRIRKCMKSQPSPFPLLAVLQMNIMEAQSAGEENKLRAFSHIYTVMNEELEKKAPKARGLLNKLLRMDDAGVRDNILRHHLTPVDMALPNPLDDDDDASPRVAAALVTPNVLASAISQFVSNVERQFSAGAVLDMEDVCFESIDKVRRIAIEARLVIKDVYGEAAMDEFGQELLPTFHSIMTYKAKQQELMQAGSQAATSVPGATAPTAPAADTGPS